MKRIRQYIRQVIIEDRKKFNSVLNADPNFDEDYSRDVDQYAEEEEVAAGYKEMVKHGEILKTAFKAAADQSFLKKLKYVHWMQDLDSLLGVLFNKKGSSEISCNAYLPGNIPTEGDFGAYGVKVVGTCTLLTNNQGKLKTGWKDLYHKAGYKDNVKKGISNYDLENIVLDASEWNPASNPAATNNSEALIDYWDYDGIIVPEDEVEDLVIELIAYAEDGVEIIKKLIESEQLMINGQYPDWSEAGYVFDWES